MEHVNTVTILFMLLTFGLLAIINAFIIQGFQNATLYDTSRLPVVPPGENPDDVVTEHFLQQSGSALASGKEIQYRDVIENKGIFWWLRHGSRDWPEWLTKPLYGCAVCMSSFHSLYVYTPVAILLNFTPFVALYIWALYVLLTAGISYYVDTLLQRNSA